MLERVRSGVSERLESPARTWYITCWGTEAASILVIIAISHKLMTSESAPIGLIVLFVVLGLLSYAQAYMIMRIRGAGESGTEDAG